MKTNPIDLDILFGKDVHYQVPDWQRLYTWEESGQWQPLWENVVELAEAELAGSDSGARSHFLGAVVLEELDKQATQPPLYSVIDGQQRLATMQLLLRAVESECVARELDTAEFYEPMLKNRPQFAPDWSYKIALKDQDREPFHQAMSGDTPTVDDPHRVLGALAFFRKRAREWFDASAPGEEAARGKALLTALKSGVVFVAIETENEDDSNMIFETLNARGTPLLAWDMVRNSMMDRSPYDSESKSHLLTFDEEWWQAEVGLARKQQTRIDSLLVRWLTMRMAEPCNDRSPRTTFATYEVHAANQDGAMEALARDLVEVSGAFREIEELSDGSPLGTFLERWRVLSASAWDPVVLWLVAELPDVDEFITAARDKALRTLESYLVRRLLTGASRRGGGSDMTRLAMDVLEALPGWERQSVGVEMARAFAELQASWPRLACPSDAELTNALVSEFPIYSRLNRRQSNMVLRAIEMDLRGSFAEAPIPANLTIEHLMPQRWNASDWPHRTTSIGRSERAKARRSELIDTIGNLTLVTRKLNSRLANRPWSKKREVLSEHTVLLMNGKILRDSDEQRWDEEDILARSEELAQLCVSIWPTPDKVG